MTVQTQTTKVTGSGNGAATVFSFSPVVIFATTDLVVTKVDANGDETALTEGTGESNYSVAAATSFPGTGSVTYPASGTTNILAAGESIVMKRVLTLEQTTDLNNQGGYFADVQETQFDKLVMLDLQQQELIERALTVPVSDALSGSSLEIPNVDDRKGNVLGFHATTGAPIAVAGATTTNVSSAMEPVVQAASVDAALDLLFAAAYNFENNIFVSDTKSLVVGHTAGVTANGITGTVQQLGTADADTSMTLGRWSADTSGPRIQFLKSRNATIGSNTIVSDDDTVGAITAVADDGSDYASQVAQISFHIDNTPGVNDTPGRIVFHTTSDGASTLSNRMTLDSTGKLIIGDTENANMTVGLTINQLANDDDIITLKSSDVAHGMTSLTEDDTFGQIAKASSTGGGLWAAGYTESITAMHILGRQTTEDTTDTTSSGGAILFTGQLKSGTTVGAIGATGNVAAIQNNSTALWLIKGNGDIHGADTDGATALDVYDDAALLRAIDLENEVNYPGKSVPPLRSRYDANRYSRQDLETVKLVGKKDAHGQSLWNKTLIESATRGAIWQNHEMLDALIDTLTAGDPGFKGKLRAEFVKRGLPTAIIDWNGAIPQAVAP